MKENKIKSAIVCVLLSLVCCLSVSGDEADSHWHSLFDGETLENWRANENADSFQVIDGAIVVRGDRSHLFYEGPVGDHNFKNLELKLEVLTKPKANSGIYVHTGFQEEGWPDKGYEFQVNNSQGDWRRTGSVYAVRDVREPPAKDNEWFDYHIIVDGKRMTVKINGETINEYVEPDDAPHFQDKPLKRLSSGTIALQAHDPGSEVHYRNIRVKLLP